jgi:succinyl-diaminopimelate desuccinylase
VTAVVRLAEDLLARRSVTPADDGCQALLGRRLEAAGFRCEAFRFGPAGAEVSNLWALREGQCAGPVLVFAGHTDVVPTGPIDRWASDPFVPTHRGGWLYARGAADMKAAIAAMVVAAEEFVAAQPGHAGAIAFLITSDEEGPSQDGTARVVELLHSRGQRLDMCVIGEPTSVKRTGDMIKNGRRGTLSGRLVVKGVQGHVAYPHLARNPVHDLAPALAELVAMHWDGGNRHFPPTTFQVSNLRAGTGAGNVIPGEAVVDFNFRFSSESSRQSLEARVHEVLDRHRVDYRLDWVLGGEPFLCAPGPLTEALAAAIEAECGLRPELSTTGGTSDGRFIARICPQVVEFGAVGESAHKIDERIEVAALEPMKNVYRRTLQALLG